MGIFYDLGRPVVGGWFQGGWVLRDPVRDRDLLWGSELGQEGAVLFAIDVDSGKVVEEHRIGCREFNAAPDPETGLLWVATNHGLFQPGTPAALVESAHPPAHFARLPSHQRPALCRPTLPCR